jgi:hypothetical protein
LCVPVAPHHRYPLDPAEAFVEWDEVRVANEIDRIAIAQAGQNQSQKFGPNPIPSIIGQYLEERDERGQSAVPDSRDKADNLARGDV